MRFSVEVDSEEALVVADVGAEDLIAALVLTEAVGIPLAPVDLRPRAAVAPGCTVHKSHKTVLQIL